MSAQQDLRHGITAEIVAALEKGVPPWRCPWSAENAGLPVNVVSKRRYTGVNILLIQLHRLRLGLKSRHYGTFNQWQGFGCKFKRRPQDVPPGKYACSIVYCGSVKKIERTRDDDEQEVEYPVLRRYTVFSADQVEGEAAERLQSDNGHRSSAMIDYGPAERAVAATGAVIIHDGDKAFYRRPVAVQVGDFIVVPEKHKFECAKEYYATLLHEVAGHWTEHRLGWTGSYAEGELRAEMASCFAMTELGVPHCDDLKNSAAYMAEWLKPIKEDSRLIFRVSADASRAVDFLLSFARQAATVWDQRVVT